MNKHDLLNNNYDDRSRSGLLTSQLSDHKNTWRNYESFITTTMYCLIMGRVLKIGFTQEWIECIEDIGYKTRISFSETVRILLEIGIIVDFFAESPRHPDKKLRQVCKLLKANRTSFHQSPEGRTKVTLNDPSAKRNEATNKNYVERPVRLSIELARYLNTMKKNVPRLSKAKLIRILLEYAVSVQLVMSNLKYEGKYNQYAREFQLIHTTRIKKIIPKNNAIGIMVDFGMPYELDADTLTRISNPKYEKDLVLNKPLEVIQK